MKFCTLKLGGAEVVGALTERGIVDITALGLAADMRALFSADLGAIQAALDAYDGAVYDPATVTFGNVTRPEKIVCAGLNYKSHAEETGGETPKYPVLFSKFADTLVPTGAAVTLPTWQRCYDYEAELVIVVGRAAYNVAVEDAEDYIFGYTCGNDLSARDAQFLSNQWLTGKNFPGFAPAGQYIVTRDAFNPEEPHGVYCEVNGARVQSGDTSDMIFTCRETLAAASRYFPLAPGDLLFTGTPAGVILGKPKGSRVWLVPGDVVRVAIDGVGELVTPLV
ncbi:MAG: fumarylacetoacetate hydrolase family protein [Oscillospiraceae bacterium]|jgi:2-keto-4-pentenoate hydratase/2-oxohepta-3-ene-1,7-dioic acid hydratase in catechol pathway|nr:fumarylacetoacetate hydrolase family protein [Oscillospiraceae bacterium]